MSIEMRYDSAHQWLWSTAHGRLTLADVFAHLDIEERRGHLGTPELFDARAASTDARASDVRRLVARMRRQADRGILGPTAFVTADAVLFGMARVYAALVEGFDPRFYVTRDLGSAERWLGLVANL